MLSYTCNRLCICGLINFDTKKIGEIICQFTGILEQLHSETVFEVESARLTNFKPEIKQIQN